MWVPPRADTRKLKKRPKFTQVLTHTHSHPIFLINNQYIISSHVGLTPEVRDDHASYIASWLTVLKNDKRAIFSAAAHAQKAVDFLHGVQQPKAEAA